ncbi:nuclear factor%2C interleukin 3 regulated, member 4 [Xyrichtys novacula]|nr:nuclear factor%2C interleukin 3 regulated, member 4 [Xyrichtys novacula]
MNDYVLESHLVALKEENTRLSAELLAIKLQFGMGHPAAYATHQSSQLQHNVHSGAHPIANTHHPSLHRDYYWVGRDSSLIPGQHLSPPLFFPAYTLQTLRGYPYLNTPSAADSALPTPLVLPRNVRPIHSARPAPPLLKPIPTRGTSDEEEEQQVPRVLSLYYPALSRKVSSREGKNYSPPRQYVSN